MPDGMSYSSSSYGNAVMPSDLQVDYDVNITSLYEAICNCDWDQAILALKQNPQEAKTWVVRHYEDDDDDQLLQVMDEEREIMWRFLPIHSACARDPPASFISALIRAYPDGPHCVDDQGMYPLHYACGNQASREVIRLLLVANSMAARCQDPRGMLPIHYLACWGPSTVSIINMVLVANRDVGKSRDNDGNTPLDLAMEGDYPERDAVVTTLKRWLEKGGTPRSGSTPRAIMASRDFFVDESGQDPPNRLAMVVPPSPRPLEPSPTDEVYENLSSENVSENVSADDISHKLTVNTTMDDEVEVKISSPLSAKDNNLKSNVENNNHHAAHDRTSDDKLTTTTPRAAAAVSPRTLSRLRREVTTLRALHKTSEEEWKRKFEVQVGELTSKCQELESQLEEMTASYATATQRVTALEVESADRDELMKMMESQLSDALEKVEGLGGENDHLRQSLNQVMAERDQKAVRTRDVTGRLGSLATSLASMMDRQEMLMQSHNEKDAQLMETSLARREYLTKLFELEQDFMEQVMSPQDQVPLYEEQMKEMDAISADIEAMTTA